MTEIDEARALLKAVCGQPASGVAGWSEADADQLAAEVISYFDRRIAALGNPTASDIRRAQWEALAAAGQMAVEHLTREQASSDTRGVRSAEAWVAATRAAQSRFVERVRPDGEH